MMPFPHMDADDAGLLEDDLPPTPLHLIMRWTRDALDRASDGGDVVEPLAMHLATVDASGAPHLRTVLMRYLDGRGPGFVSHLGSPKAVDMSGCPKVAASLDWLPMFRVIRFQGEVERIDDLDVSDYWHSRTWEAKTAAAAGQQSGTIKDRAEFDGLLTSIRDLYPRGREVPMPESFVGWRIRCTSVEFWAGRTDRSHDRLLFTNPSDLELDNPGWRVSRLMP